MGKSKIRNGLGYVAGSVALAGALLNPYRAEAHDSEVLREDHQHIDEQTALEVSKYGDQDSSKRIILFPQVHGGIGRSSSLDEDVVRSGQFDIAYSILKSCNNPCYVFSEGFQGELNHKDLEEIASKLKERWQKENPELTSSKLENAVKSGFSEHAPYLIEYMGKDKVRTIGVDDPEVTFEAMKLYFDYLDKLKNFDIEGYVNGKRKFNEVGVERRTNEAAKNVVDYMDKEGIKNAFLIYGARHTEGFIREFDDVDLRVAYLESQKKMSEEIKSSGEFADRETRKLLGEYEVDMDDE
jgi:hypothetical protein|tara:strand:- start:320 stop:1210 length:891 start_codon:yes stop_codon:yes gene_type:complete